MNTLLDSITAIMAEQNTSLSESFFEAVLNRLVSFGYELQETDAWELCFCMMKVENHIKNTCNIKSVPEGLFQVAVDRVCGEFFNGRKASGNLVIGDLDFDGAVSSIKEGDASVNFDTGTSDDEKFSVFLNYLMHEGEEGDLVCYRKLKW